ncbi:hypothetical protein D9758_004428 [Tetrapyrgos nigripes]|uniref:Reverse transcriptase domain-containing protein n=1 Tax=Tetrapyrgos nigripes TaxID=182062 RepID=A0A8H5LS32_9AGAR|nr:hypothetical protein D9758_004428 [Tetrapyrgos nigripes]
MRLGTVALALLHPNQAGFVKGRYITDQTKLIRMVMTYTEATEKNGLIVSLDQEKAYNKVWHDYLWKVLEKYEFPSHFTKTVKYLYEPAKTTVMINGERSKNFHVHRGVRQGDPLSCLIFDLAIEPLAEMIRDSNLKGYDIPGTTEHLIVNLFADNTTTFLHAEDNFEELQRILDKWCLASGAKFNIAKTEIIPIGEKTYHVSVTQTRKTNEHAQPLPTNLHIAMEGEAVRILGAWYGNEIKAEQIWARNIEKVDSNLERWAKGSPSMEGRCHIIQMMIGGIIQYLTMVQGMPKSVEKRLAKCISTYLWEEKERNPVKKEVVFSNFDKGGRRVLDI